MEGRILILKPTSIAKYMALSETIQESVGKGYPVTVVLSPGWKQKGISIGKKQRIEYVDLKSCREDGIEVVRRHVEKGSTVLAALSNLDELARYLDRSLIRQGV